MYFLETPSNEWDLKKAFVSYLKDHDVTVVKELMKKDLSVLKNSANCGKKTKTKADEYMQLLDKKNTKDVQKYADKSGSSSMSTNNVRIHSKNIENINISNVYNSEKSGVSKPNNEVLSENVEGHAEEQENDDINDLIPSVATKRTSAADFHRLIFKAGYEQFKSKLSLQVVQEINIMAQQLKPTNLAESLDHLACRIINSSQSAESDHVLKLSLSRILFLVGGTTLKVYRQLFHDQSYYNELLKRKPPMEPGLSNAMVSLFNEVVYIAKHGISRTRQHLMEKRLEVLKNDGNETEEMELLDILDFVISNFDYQAKKKKKSELAYYRYAASILDIIFRNQEFGLNDGEICSKSTKDARITNMKVCNDVDDKKPIFGRKIDLILVSMSMEVSCSEWKKYNTSPALVEQQQIKNCRTNSSILHNLKKLPIAEKEKEDMFVLGMEWIGDIGFMVSVREFEKAHLVHHVGDLSLPRSLRTLEDFRQTLDLLYSYKHHYMKMKDIIEIAQRRYTIDQNLARYRLPEEQLESMDEEPKTFFTPVKKQKTSHPLTNRLDEDNEDDLFN